ncbi:MAG TPA: Rho termination factor N-terminal domain-containing protein [Solirubrobacterales bacterium]|jgi:transcription termination factor Rho|nr:Rho termination factor N-terminal domain-containing protein [Solirubrobacterales bacterium]
MTKAELESKHLSELHLLAAEAGMERYRMLTRGELIAKLAETGGFEAGRGESGRSAERPRPARERPRRRRRRGTGDELGDEAYGAREEAPQRGQGEGARPREGREEARESLPEPAPPERAPAPQPAREPVPAAEARPRRRRRRRFGRRGKERVAIQDLLLPPEAGRQTILCAETREACTTLLRGVAADLAAASKGPDPVVLLIDPGPEELADWKREAPQAEIVSAGQARHAEDALAQAAARAGRGEDVILLVDSLTRLATDFSDADSAKELFDAGRAQGGTGGGSLTIVAALERPAS